AVFLHEIGHVLASLRLGRRIRGTVLFPIGGVALADAHEPENSSLADDLRIALAGPMVNLFLAGVSGLIFLGFFPAGARLSRPWISITYLGKSFVWINLALVAINLVPAFPLDAGRLLRDFLAKRMEYNKATRRAVFLGHLCAGGLILAGSVSQWMMVAGFVLFMATQMEERTAMFQSVAETVQMEDIMLT